VVGAQTCQQGNKVVGIDETGALLCGADLNISGQSCPAGQFVTGVAADGTLECAAPFTYHRCFYNGDTYVEGTNLHVFEESECVGGLPQGNCMAALRMASHCGRDEDWRALGPDDPDGPGVRWWVEGPCNPPLAGVDYLCFP
jgi:hypothetical protein